MVTDTNLSSLAGNPPEAETKRNPLWRGMDVLLMTIVIIVLFGLGLAMTAGLSVAGGAQFGSGDVPLGFMLGTLAVQAMAMAGGVWLMGLKRRGYTWTGIGLRPTTRGWVAASVGIFIVMRIAVTLLALLLAQLGITSMQAQALAPAGFSWISAIGMTVLAGLVIPIVEEIFFRGVVYRWLRDKWGIVVGVIVSGLVFGIAHFEPATVVPAIVMGFVLALVYEKSHSLWPPILIHMLNNTLAIAALYAFLGTGGTLPAQ
jgi:membrane protease YdiL (CAAX protease family)